jgi:hypothetical protein
LFREQWGRVKAGVALDHFLPVAVHPEYEGNYDNLLYACAACNQAKGVVVLPDPSQVLVDEAVWVRDDGRIEGTTPEARRLIRVLGLDSREETEVRLLWIGIMALAERFDPVLHQGLIGFPDDLPNLPRLRPPGGNTRPQGLAACFLTQRRAGTLPARY